MTITTEEEIINLYMKLLSTGEMRTNKRYLTRLLVNGDTPVNLELGMMDCMVNKK